MRRSLRTCASSASADRGFTLIEVVVSLSLLAILATSALYFFIAGTRSVTHLQRAHGAVALANDAMEEAYSWVATASTTGTSGLVVGRTEDDVTKAWESAVDAGVTGVGDTFPAWDTAALPAPLAGTADDTIALTASATESRAVYNVTTLIGTCYRAASVVDGPCTTIGGDPSGAPDAGYVRMMRVIVTVNWPDTAGSCGGTTCSYEIASLIDPNSDVEWNNTTRLLLVDDSVQVDAGESVVIAVLANDTLPKVASNPVTIPVQPKSVRTDEFMGEAVLDAHTGKVTYTASPTSAATAAPHGEVTFKYQVQSPAGNASAVVHVHVKPRALSISWPGASGTTVLPGAAVNIPVTTVSLERAAGLTVTAGTSVGTVPAGTANPAAGSVVPASDNASFVYTAPSAVGTYSFGYTYLDADGITSLQGIVTVTVATPAPIAVPVPGSFGVTVEQGHDLTIQLTSSPTTSVEFRLTGAGPTCGSLSNFQPASGAVKFSAHNSEGSCKFTYRVRAKGPDSDWSADATVSATITATVVPVPSAFDVDAEVKKDQSVKISLESKPDKNVEYEIVDSPDCGTLGVVGSNGKVDFSHSGGVAGCTFTYKVRSKNPISNWSDIATVTIKLKTGGKG